MNLRLLMAILFTLVVSGCGGSGGAGLNGGLTVTATVSGPVVTATATYTNPDKTNLIGVPITFTIDLPGSGGSSTIGTFNTNNSGSIGVAFTAPPFNGTQTIVITAKTGNLSNFATVSMTGRTLTLTPPANQGPITATGNPGTLQTFTFSGPNFVAITDPFTSDLSSRSVTLTATFTSIPQSAGDQMILSSNSPVGPGVPANTLIVTGASGIAPLPGASLTLVVPNAGVTKTATISWTATHNETGLSGSGTTVVSLTR